MTELRILLAEQLVELARAQYMIAQATRRAAHAQLSRARRMLREAKASAMVPPPIVPTSERVDGLDGLPAVERRAIEADILQDRRDRRRRR